MLGYARILQQSRGDLWENPLRVGEVVSLKSGGPRMTVVEVGEKEGDMVRVVWLDGVGVMHTEGFIPGLLERSGRKRSFFGRWR